MDTNKTIASIHSLKTLDRFDDLMKLNMTVHTDLPERFFRQYVQMNPASNNPAFHRFILHDDKIVAGTSLIQHKIYWHGAEIPASEIGLVGTLEEHRNKGYSTALMNDCLDSMRSDGIPISFLWGIPDFYERFHYYYGYPNHFSAYISLPKSCTEDLNKTGRIRKATSEDLEAIKRIYREYNKAMSGWQIRSDEMWDYYFDLTSRDEKHAWWVAGAPVKGYAFVGEPVKSGTFACGELPVVQEIGFIDSDEASLIDLILGLFHEHPEMEKLDFYHHPKAPIGEWLFRRGAQVRSAEDIWRGSWAGMVRLIDTAKLLSLMTGKFNERLANSRFYKYTSEIPIESEVGGAVISISDGEAIVQNSGKGPGIHIPACVLTPIVTGYHGFERYRNGLTNIPNEIKDILAALFPGDRIFMHHLLYIDEEK